MLSLLGSRNWEKSKIEDMLHSDGLYILVGNRGQTVNREGNTHMLYVWRTEDEYEKLGVDWKFNKSDQGRPCQQDFFFFYEKVIIWPRPSRIAEASNTDTCRNSQYQGPEAGAFLENPRNSKEAGVAGRKSKEKSRGRWDQGGQRGQGSTQVTQTWVRWEAAGGREQHNELPSVSTWFLWPLASLFIFMFLKSLGINVMTS